MHISREHKVLLMNLPYLALEQGVILDREPLSVKVIVISGPRVYPVPTNFIKNIYSVIPWNLFTKLQKSVCKTKKTSVIKEGSSLLWIGLAGFLFVLNRVRVWVPQWHSSSQVCHECPSPGFIRDRVNKFCLIKGNTILFKWTFIASFSVFHL